MRNGLQTGKTRVFTGRQQAVIAQEEPLRSEAMGCCFPLGKTISSGPSCVSHVSLY